MRKIRIRKKDQSNSRAPREPLRKLQLTVLFMMLCFACAVSSAGTSKLYPPKKDEAGALRLAQVMQTATREEILKLTVQREHLLASGLKDSDFQDGSLAMGRVYVAILRRMKGQPFGSMFPPTRQCSRATSW